MANKTGHYNPTRAHRLQEVFRVLEAWGLRAHVYLWNTCKYVARCIYSGKPVQDRIKARWYLERDIQLELVRVIEEYLGAPDPIDENELFVLTDIADYLRNKARPTQVLHPLIMEALKARKQTGAAPLTDKQIAEDATAILRSLIVGRPADMAWIKNAAKE